MVPGGAEEHIVMPAQSSTFFGEQPPDNLCHYDPSAVFVIGSFEACAASFVQIELLFSPRHPLVIMMCWSFCRPWHTPARSLGLAGPLIGRMCLYAFVFKLTIHNQSRIRKKKNLKKPAYRFSRVGDSAAKWLATIDSQTRKPRAAAADK